MRGRAIALASLLSLGLVGRPARVQGQTHLLIVSGLGGDAKFADAFKTLGLALSTAAHQRYGLPDSEIVLLAEDTAKGGGRIAARSTKEEIERTLERFRARAGASDQLVIVLIGHGSPEGADSKISLPGPDMTAADFAKDLAKWPTQRVAFVNATSASGDFLPVLSAPNRVVITATKSSFERNESVFAAHFVEALTKDGADTDKDGRISLLEAFQYATAETKRAYEQDSKLQTEHAQLDDDGDHKGSPEPDGKTEGLLARRFFLDTPGAVAKAGGGSPGDVQLAALYKDKSNLEERIDALKKKKTSMTEDAYDDALEDLLVQLARKSLSIRQLEGRSQ